MADQFPDELIQLVATATEQHHIEYGVTDGSGNNPCVCGQWWDSSDVEGWDEHMAAVALAALAEAGRLLPASARLVEELGVRVDREHPRRKEKVGQVMTHLCRESVLAAPKIWDGWTVVKRPAIKWAGPWEVLTDSKDKDSTDE